MAVAPLEPDFQHVVEQARVAPEERDRIADGARRYCDVFEELEVTDAYFEGGAQAEGGIPGQRDRLLEQGERGLDR